MVQIIVQSGYNKPNRYLDILQEEAFTINSSITSVTDIGNSTGTYTKSLKLPDTTNNREIFGYISHLATATSYNYTSNVGNSFNPNLKVKCWVLENSILVMEGYIQFNGFSVYENHRILDVTIYSDNSNFYIEMGDQLLTDIDFSEYSFTYSQAKIQSTWTNAPDSYKNGVYFPLIDYGHGWTLDDVNNPQIYQLGVKDFLPAVSVKTIWDKLFMHHGYSYKSNFLGEAKTTGSAVPNSKFGNLYIPYTQQSFQTSLLFNQDKIFHVGLVGTRLGQSSTYAMGPYIAKTYPSATTTPKEIVNATVYAVGGSVPNSTRYQWYSGRILNPWAGSSLRNTAASHFSASSTYQFTSTTLPFSLTASPMFNTSVGGGNTYNTSSFYYQNRTNEIFKQRFVLNTDIVTTFGIDCLKVVDEGLLAAGFFKYVMSVNFYREFNPTTGVADPAWASGTGVLIPPDLGGADTIAHNMDGSVANKTFWICDKDGKSNVFDKDGQLIVPTGENRYLGKYATNERGDLAVEADSATASISWRGASGDCVAMYDNDGANQGVTNLVGMWVTSNFKPSEGYSSSDEATAQPRWGDWYQKLNLQTIYLDGDTTNTKYGAAGTIQVNGNKPIYPNEKVRCVVTFGSRYYGQQFKPANHQSYIPPVSAYILTNTNFAGDTPYPFGLYQNPASNNRPLTQFFNDVSNDYIDGMRVDFNDIIPKNVKQKDFLQSIVRMHNLYIEPIKNTPNTLLIEPREDYYRLGRTLDWRKKLDLSTPPQVKVLADIQNKRTTFSFKADSDWYNKQYTQQTNKVYGEFNFTLENQFVTGEKKIDVLFSPTPMAPLFSSLDGGDMLVRRGAFILPVIVSGNNIKPNSNNGPNGSVQNNYRILYKNVIDNQNSERIKLFGVDTHTYPYIGPYNNPYAPTYAVQWGQTEGEFFNSPTDQFFDNLVNCYWSGLLTEMSDLGSRLITCNMFLTPADLNSFHFYDVVKVNIDGVDGYYKVTSIENYSPGQSSICKVTLLKTNDYLPMVVYTGSSGTGGGIPAIPTPIPIEGGAPTS